MKHSGAIEIYRLSIADKTEVVEDPKPGLLERVRSATADLSERVLSTLVTSEKDDEVIQAALVHRRIMYLGAETPDVTTTRGWLKTQFSVDMIDENNPDRFTDLVRDYGAHVDAVIIDRDQFPGDALDFTRLLLLLRRTEPTLPIIVLGTFETQANWPLEQRTIGDVMLRRPMASTDLWFGLREAFLRANARSQI